MGLAGGVECSGVVIFCVSRSRGLSGWNEALKDRDEEMMAAAGTCLYFAAAAAVRCVCGAIAMQGRWGFLSK